MITSRDLGPQPIEGRQPVEEQPVQQHHLQAPRESITIRRKVNTPSGSMYSTVTLEAVTDSEDVVVVESFSAQQPVTFASIIGRIVDFRSALIDDGYTVKEHPK